MWEHFDANPLKRFTYYTIDFTSADWLTPVRVSISARPDAAWEDPQTAVITFVRDDSDAVQDGSAGNPFPLNSDGTVNMALVQIDDGKTNDPHFRYVFPNLRSGTGTTAVEVFDDETPTSISIESGTGTVVQKCGNSACTVAYDTGDQPFPTGDWYTIRLTKQPTGIVRVAILTDGMVDVVGDRRRTRSRRPTTRSSAARSPTRLFLGNLSISSNGLTLTRANGSELGSFVDEGFERRNLIRVTIKRRRHRQDVRPRDRGHRHRGHRRLDHARRRRPARGARLRRQRRRQQDRHRLAPLGRGLLGGPGAGRRHVRCRASAAGRLADRPDRDSGRAATCRASSATASSRASGSRSASRTAPALHRDDRSLQDRDHPRRQRRRRTTSSSSARTSTCDGVFHLVDDLGIFGATGTLLPNMLIRRIAAGRRVQRRRLVRVAARRPRSPTSATRSRSAATA